MLMWLNIFNLIFIIPVTLCDKNVPCDLSDDTCVTAAHKLLLKKVIAGDPLLNLKSSDPLHQDIIQVFLPDMNITLTDPYMYGTLACETQHVKLDSGKWLLTMFCPKLTLETNYEINGDVDSVHIEGKGKCEIIYEKYLIGLSGELETYADWIGLDHFHVTSYKLDFTEVQGRVIYNFANLFDGDKQKSAKVHEYINKNWKKLHDIIGNPITYSLWGYFIDNANDYVALIPKLDVFMKPLSFLKFPVQAVQNILF